MTLREYVRILRERWRPLVAGLVLGVLGAGLFVLLQPAAYAATVTVIVAGESSGPDPTAAYQADQVPAQRMATYVELMRSPKIAGDVVGALQLAEPPAELAARVEVTNPPDTVLLVGTVTDGSADRAVRIADALGAEFVRNVGEIEQPADPAARPLVTAKVFQPATAPAEQVAPRPVRSLLVGALIGLVAGFAVAVARHLLDTSVRNAEQAAELTGVPTLAVVGRDPELAGGPHLLAGGGHRSAAAEAFRRLRTNVRFVDVDRAHGIVLVTSAMVGEGKTTVAANLALVMAEAGPRVLLVDADLRRPGVAAAFGVDGTIGLTDVLVDRLPVTDTVVPVAPSLDVLPGGQPAPNPSELLGSARAATVLAQLREGYDVVLVDCAPLLPATDAAVLAPAVDGVLLVIRHGRTGVSDVRAARDALAAVSGRLMGTVLTGAPVPRHARYGRDHPARDRGTDRPAPAPTQAEDPAGLRTGPGERPDPGP